MPKKDRWVASPLIWLFTSRYRTGMNTQGLVEAIAIDTIKDRPFLPEEIENFSFFGG
jgi:hypothetical protein